MFHLESVHSKSRVFLLQHWQLHEATGHMGGEATVSQMSAHPVRCRYISFAMDYARLNGFTWQTPWTHLSFCGRCEFICKTGLLVVKPRWFVVWLSC